MEAGSKVKSRSILTTKAVFQVFYKLNLRINTIKDLLRLLLSFLQRTTLECKAWDMHAPLGILGICNHFLAPGGLYAPPLPPVLNVLVQIVDVWYLVEVAPKVLHPESNLSGPVLFLQSRTLRATSVSSFRKMIYYAP